MSFKTRPRFSQKKTIFFADLVSTNGNNLFRCIGWTKSQQQYKKVWLKQKSNDTRRLSQLWRHLWTVSYLKWDMLVRGRGWKVDLRRCRRGRTTRRTSGHVWRRSRRCCRCRCCCCRRRRWELVFFRDARRWFPNLLVSNPRVFPARWFCVMVDEVTDGEK